MQVRIPEIFKNRIFLAVLALKIIFAFLFGSDYIVKLFAPSINYFVASGFQNPYDFLVSQGMLKAFPYSTAMLAILAIPRLLFSPLLSPDWQQVTFLHLFALRIPILLADIGILYILSIWLRGKEKRLIALYWCSPILFYINYFHGQLDAIPIALLLASLLLLFERKFAYSAAFLSISIAAKASMLIAIPFILVFLWKNERKLQAVASYALIAGALFSLLVLPYAFSEGYRKMVAGSDEQQKLFSFFFDYGYLSTHLFIAPAVIVAIFFVFSSFSRLNRDILLMVLCLVFIAFVALVPPMPGWYYWSVPLLAFFFVKEEKAPLWGYFFLNFFYLAYFAFRPDSDVFNSFQLLSPQIAALGTPYLSISRLGLDAGLISNILFTALTSLLLAISFWLYRIGIRSNLEWKARIRPTMIGICGDSGTGKSHLASLLSSLFGSGNSITVNGDDMHKWERGSSMWEAYTHLNPKGNRLHLDMEQAIALKGGDEVYRAEYDHKSGKFGKERKVSPNKFVIFTGLHLFFLRKMRMLFDVKVFLEPDEELRREWKLERDTHERRRGKDEVIKQIEKRKPDFAKYVLPQKKFADLAVSYSKGENGNGLCIQIRVKNDVNVDGLSQVLSGVQGIGFDYTPEENLYYTTIEFSGNPSPAQVESLAYKAVPNLEELVHAKPEWKGGTDGLLQLFFLYYLSEKFRERGATWHAL